MRLSCRLALANLFFILIALLFLLLALPAGAHESWINWGGYISPVDGMHCCGEADCAVLPRAAVRISRAGYALSLPDGRRELVPFAEAQPSEDGQYWRCRRFDGSRRCFFAPMPGS